MSASNSDSFSEIKKYNKGRHDEKTAVFCQRSWCVSDELLGTQSTTVSANRKSDRLELTHPLTAQAAGQGLDCRLSHSSGTAFMWRTAKRRTFVIKIVPRFGTKKLWENSVSAHFCSKIRQYNLSCNLNEFERYFPREVFTYFDSFS